MITKDRTYRKIEYSNKLENKLGSGKFISSLFLNLMLIWKLTVPGFTHLVVHQKTNKDRVYTPMGSSTKTSVVVYAHFGG